MLTVSGNRSRLDPRRITMKATASSSRRQRQRRRRDEAHLRTPSESTTAPYYSSLSSSSSKGLSGNTNNRHEKESIYSLRCLVRSTIGFVAAIGLLVFIDTWRGSLRSPSSSTSSETRTASLKETSSASTTSTNISSGSVVMTSSDHRTAGPASLWYTSTHEVPESVVAELDVVFVLGGGRPVAPDLPPTYVQNRCDDAAAIVRRRRQLQQQDDTTGGSSSSSSATASENDLPVLCLSAGTAHVPQLLASTTGLPVWESTASASYLLRHHNLHPSSLFVETTSYDTIGNAYFARTSHAEWNQWRRILIVTSEFHMARSKAIFDWIFSVPRHQGADLREEDRYQLYYLSSPDVGLDDEALEARREREQSSLASVHKLVNLYHSSLRDVWRFLHTNHDLYTASKLVERSGGSGGTNNEGQRARRIPDGSGGEDRGDVVVSPNDAVIKSYGAT